MRVGKCIPKSAYDFEHHLAMKKRLYEKRPCYEVDPATGQSTKIPWEKIEADLRSKQASKSFKHKEVPHGT